MSDKRILIIDDEADVREIAKASLRITRQWEILVAASGPEGVAIAAQTQPDAILLDMMMPEMDGLATLNCLCENPDTASIAVILLTAAAQTNVLPKYAVLGVKALLVKPFDPGTLADQIEQALGW